jgi:anthranilate phosphoribosyltransferase
VIDRAIAQVTAGHDLSRDEMTSVMDLVMRGACSQSSMVQFLAALTDKGESVNEVAGAAVALRRHMTRLASPHAVLVDTCGTGGDGSRTFNISTAAALVTAAAGVPVAKHGNRGFTSTSGSADVLAALGVNIQADVASVERCLAQLGICFCFAPLLHPSMKHVAAARREVALPTIFNLIGPLCNPAAAPFQLLGVGRPALWERLAAALCQLGTRRSAVVRGADGLDEVTLTGPTHVLLVENQVVRPVTWEPSDFGLEPVTLEGIQVSGPAESAAVIREVLRGGRGPARDIVLLNAAAALWLAGRVPTLQSGVVAAAEAVDGGHAQTLLERLAALSHA